MKDLPLSLQYFPRIINLNYLYVDKTKYAHDLITQEQSFFLARPRRFGKSLFVSTLEEVLKGNKELFEGLWIGKSNCTWPVHGVIHLDFGPIKSASSQSVDKTLCQMLVNIALDYEISLITDFTDPNSIDNPSTRSSRQI